MIPDSIDAFIKSEESRYETDEISVGSNWRWNMRNHIQLIFHLKNGVFFTGQNNWLRAFKNIMEPILNLADWMEDIEVKDIVFFIEGERGRILSFLLKKYHDEVYVKDHDIDKMIDAITESDNAYGGVLLQGTSKAVPEVVKLTQIAFCDQTDILGSPIGLKFHFSPSTLRKFKKRGWGNEKNGATVSIEELITLASFEKEPAGANEKANHVPGKTVELYIVRGDLPEHYLLDNGNMKDYYSQLHIVAYYTREKTEKQYGCLYRKREYEDTLKFHTSKEVDGRALGRGFGEMMLHPQIWTNFLAIHKMGFLESASKVPLYTDDSAYANRNKIQDMENLEITVIEEGKEIKQVPTAAPVNVQMISNAIAEWYDFAQLSGSAFDPLLGKGQPAGTTFRGQERVVAQGAGTHEKRRGHRAKFIEQIYRDWIIPDMLSEIFDGTEFLATLSSDEMAWVGEQLANNYATRRMIAAILEGADPEEAEALRQFFLEDFGRQGGRQMLKILKNEFRDKNVKVGINIGSKQKDLAGLSDKLFSIIETAIANPVNFEQAMKIPAFSKAFNTLVEYGGLNPADFATIASAPIPSPLQAEMLQTETKTA